MLINFNPLSTEKTKLPSGATFVVANSLVTANKAATSHYNCRVMECRLAAKIIALKHGKFFFKCLVTVNKLPFNDINLKDFISFKNIGFML